MPRLPVALEMLMFVGFFVTASLISKRRQRPSGTPAVFADMWANLGHSFTGWNALYWVGAVAVTVLLVWTGWDRALQDAFYGDLVMSRRVSWFVLVAGNLWTFGLALSVLLIGRSRRNRGLRGAGVASMQAVLTTWLVTTLLKGLSGRMGPAHAGDLAEHAAFPKTVDASNFAFDFWNHVWTDGRFFWPSGHTSSAMTLVSALVAYYPDKRWIALIGYPLVVFTALAMVDGDMHWVSDVLAGALIGHIIGWTVGQRKSSAI